MELDAVSEIGCGDTGKVNSLINRLTSFRRNNGGQLLIFTGRMNTKARQNKRAEKQ